MQFKPYSVYVGYDNKVTEYQNGKKGKFPTTEVIEWLHENVGLDCWQFDWDPPVDPVVKNVDNRSIIDHINEVCNQHYRSGATFYFDKDEDRLLFCLKWISEGIEEPLFWHPV